ncbi:hypothetical protein CO112_01415 [Candidatus Dojkabacteria bacterium CG_4_9_14_3_um_filter_150_Dojkabacteria_WS6_41_13]|uniref:Phosphatidate cytidylyltransferase n=1 Tax=Candidatus Dojkabacteria bacterium CG_4_10_14_0_2_um_filter_Dojkabacteria_WS6_41_15 TaxID=2014249 RepID=A0A2M7W1L8_9BACT|nr:MAG: hypothetical protein COX64_03035 [Candidatus Dojkabacteria bacterium CG_4_10_14_0_2_um_filter_Dojkabacteria_WS6_41_15]PJB23109.1 MAG: hypothetical protein CO112_01415 [Candidatus Dojkabacteria bacterium CG_4_9_14_3_um_filter_150_Dojkabacteria_WS6_41_13]
MMPFLVGTLFLLFYVSLEVLKRNTSINPQITRKVAHLLSGVGVIVGSGFLNQTEFVILTIIFFVLFSVSRYYKLQKSIIVPGKQGFGELYYSLVLVLLGISIYLQRDLFIQTILILSVSDTASWLPGYLLQSKTKTIWGSCAYFLSALVILLAFNSLIFSVVAALLLTVVEYYSPNGSDNLTTPGAFLLLCYFFR